MCVSLNDVFSDEPRCPLVPNATCSSTSSGSGTPGVVRRHQVRDVDQVLRLGGLSSAGVGHALIMPRPPGGYFR